MELLPLRSNLTHSLRELLPLSVYTAGTEIQPPITRMKGFSAHQLFLTLSGSGRFRRLQVNKDKWDILGPGQLLYIPPAACTSICRMENNPGSSGTLRWWRISETC